MFKEKIRIQLLGGSLTDHGSYTDGNYQGYPVVITTESTVYHVRINAVSAQDPDNTQLAQYLEYQKQNVKHLVDYSCTSTSVLLTIKMPAVNGNKVPDMINGVVEPLIQYLSSGNYLPCCESCGSTQEYLSNYEVNGSYHYLCTSCAQQIEQNLQQNQQTTRAKKSNLVAGLVGAFVGSLIGCALWVLIYRLGYIAGIAGAVTAICALRGYELLGGHLDRKGVIISTVMMLVMIFFANRLSWTWDAYDALKDEGYTFSECYQYLDNILDLSELTGSYYSELFIGYGLTLLCSVRRIIDAFRTSSGSYRMKKAQ